MVEVTVKASNPTRVLEVLSDPEFVKSMLPYVVARNGDEITLMFSRIFFKFSDTYRVKTEASLLNGFIRHILTGRRSTIVIEYRALGDKIVASIDYRGPRSWVVRSKLDSIARSLVDDAVRAIETKVGEIDRQAADYSRLLASIAWTSKLLLKSMLLRNELVTVQRGGLMSYIEKLISEGLMGKHKVIYISGSGSNSVFRMLFIDGVLRGVYAVIDGKEYYGNDRVLNEIEGIVRVKIYAALKLPEEGGQ